MVRKIVALAIVIATNEPSLGDKPSQAIVPVTRRVGVSKLLDSSYGGLVSAVDADSITIVYPGGEETSLRYAPGGTLIDKTITITPPQPPKRFRMCATLAKGGFDISRGASHTYRLSDVKVGDMVCIDCHSVGGVHICDRISIQRRPGGRVPPAPGQPPHDPLPWDDRCNAQQDFEERGIPLPDRFAPPSFLFENPRIAPMPRLVTPKALPPGP